jgi:uncharacterized protein YkwD
MVTIESTSMRWALPGACVLAGAIALVPLGEALADPAAAPSDQATIVARVLDLTNAQRGNAGLPPLALSRELQAAAQTYSHVLASGACFAHTCGPMPNFVDRDAAAGYRDWTALGENLAGGYPTPEAVMAGWMASPEHRENVLSASFTDVGIGVTTSGGRYRVYWAAEFGTRDDD